MPIFIIAGFILVAAASFVFHLGFPQQQYLATTPSAGLTRLIAAVLLLISLVVISQVIETAVAVFMVILFCMVSLMVIPAIGSLWVKRQRS